ncbi:MAG: acyltransferase [Oscillospiraceae bacterium]|nr:acyltransferase [Oscillospiraceae bacterium]
MADKTLRAWEPGIDLLRCIGLLFVNALHAFLYNGFYYEHQTELILWGANSFRWLFFTCNGIFMILTGYLKTATPWGKKYYKSLWLVLIGYLLTCVISFPIRHFLIGEHLTLLQWLEKMVTFANYAWYIEMYIGLLLISPFINLALDKLNTKQQTLLALTMVILTAVPTVTPLNIAPDYWTALYPLTYYTLGAVIQRCRPSIHPLLALVVVLLTVCGLGLTTLLTTDAGFSKGYGQGYGGFWITLAVVFLLLSVYRLRIPKGAARVLRWLSGGCFEGYILSRLFDVWIYGQFPQWHSPEKYPLIFICVTIPVFIVSILSGKLVHSLSVRLYNWITAFFRQRSVKT